jgi:hypothetical protein
MKNLYSGQFLQGVLMYVSYLTDGDLRNLNLATHVLPKKPPSPAAAEP